MGVQGAVRLGNERGQIQLQLRHFLGQVKLCRSFQPYRKKSRGSSGSRPPNPGGRELRRGRWTRAPPARIIPGNKSIEKTNAVANGQALISGNVAAGGVTHARTEGEAGCGGHRPGPTPAAPLGPWASHTQSP